MNKSIALFFSFSLTMLSCSSCSRKDGMETCEVEEKLLREDISQKGNVEKFAYSTKDYLYDSQKTQVKECNVYLPYGYDESRQYDILYLIHGTDKQSVDHINTWFETVKAKVLLDNMIYYKMIDPLIVVAPTFYSYGLYGDDDVKDIRQTSPVKEKSNENFIRELRYDIVPNVEKRYNTYSSSEREEDLIASRDHRAIAGLSNGCRLTLRAGLVNNFDYFSYFGCYSSSIGSQEILTSLNQEKYKGMKVNYMFNADGIFDFAYNQHRKMVDELLKDENNHFTSENTEYVKITMGYHSNRSWRVALYDSLLRFFK